MTGMAEKDQPILIARRDLEVLHMAAEAAVEMHAEAPDMVGHLMPDELLIERPPDEAEIADGVPEDDAMTDVSGELAGALARVAGVLGIGVESLADAGQGTGIELGHSGGIEI